MAFWSLLFGSPKVVETVADAAGTVVKGGMSMLDNAFYTEQEKAANASKVMDVFLKLQMTWANDNSVSAVIRRVISTICYTCFFALVFFACIVYKWDKEWAFFIVKMIVDLQIGWIIVTITAATFGLYGIGKYISKDNIPYSTASIDGTGKCVEEEKK
jgi:hypothetical protein